MRPPRCRGQPAGGRRGDREPSRAGAGGAGRPAQPAHRPGGGGIGGTYPFDLYTHCGIEYAPFGGKTWKAITPRPEPRPKAGENGITIYNGYTAGTMTLVDTFTARFVVDLRYADVSEPVVGFELSERPAPACK